MKKLIASLLFSISLIFALILLVTGPTSAQEPEIAPPKGPEATPDLNPSPTPIPIDRTLLPKIEPQLLKKLLESNEPASFIVYLKTQADLSAAVSAAPSDIKAQAEPDPLATRTTIVNALQQTARATQADVLQTLQTPAAGNLSGQNAAATDISPLWIVNAVAARGTLETVLEVAARPDVAVVRLDKKIQLAQPILDYGFTTLDCGRSNCLSAIHNPKSPNSSPKSQIPNRQSTEWGISRIRADLVHNALGIDGTGMVVANIDSGVDWLHPALQTKYRGYTGAGHLPLHVGNWFDATGDGATYPIDTNGHGTHTMGTMVGDNGIGVAPGAQWIAAKAFDSTGSGQFSWLHAAFQWMLAPNGDPALAPDIVNNSWGSNNGTDTEFEADIQVLLKAGIYPVFSAGNNGPETGTVGSPGSLNISLAVGATTIDDEIANFSGRGPSPWGQIKPEVSAPGKDVRSSVPGGAYASFDGTSMAAPHAAGLAALLLQTAPTLANNLTDISNAMKSTAVPLGAPSPNNDYGWGRIDAYNAVMSVGSVGTMQGTVTRADSGSPINGATVQMRRRSAPDIVINTTTDASGAYLQGLAGGTYDATASAFGYESITAFNLQVATGSTIIQDFTLPSKPTGTLRGTVREAGTNTPLVATISIEGTPAGTTSDTGGNYNLTLPIGTYTLTVVAPRHRIAKVFNLTINDGATVSQDIWLEPAPGILLVDSGRWYQESEIGYYQQALDDLLYLYDTWQITAPFDPLSDIPTAADLAKYDLVIWSSPLDSPGYIGADAALESYLDEGGKLLLSGQDIAYFDSGGAIISSSATYLGEYLKARFEGENSQIFTASGIVNEPFDGLFLTLNGGDGANNQFAPDVISVAEADFAGPLLAYDDDNLAGLHVGLCLPYRAMFFSFGFEAINSRTDRSQVMERAIDWLTQLPAETEVELTPPTETLIGSFGSTVPHTIRIRNTGTKADTYDLSFTSNWPFTANPANTVSLGACISQTIDLGVTVNTTTRHISDTLTAAAQSINYPAVTDTAIRITKSPAPVLLVDDDRWYSFAAEYQKALAANNIPYDYWLVPKSWVGPVPPSPSLATLQMYPLTVWYTAYDWYQPLATEEEERLAIYLDGGGRLLFSSQDYIYNLPDREPSAFARDYLGVLDHTEDFSSTVVLGESRNPVGDHLGPYELTFPPGYNNWTDALTPTVTAQIASRGQVKQPNGLTNAGSGPGPGGENWHTNFLAYGLELLAAPERARLLQRSLGWLSWLGKSTTTPSNSAALPGTVITYTATVINDGREGVSTASFTATRPAELAWVSYSTALTLSGENLVWNGPLAMNESKIFTYTATIADPLPLGTVISQTSWLAYPEHNILFDRIATVYVNFPDLSKSQLNVTPTEDVEAGDTLTYTIVLRNDGLVDAPMVTTTNTLPHMLELSSPVTPSQGNVLVSGSSITWTTPLSKDEIATLTYQAVISYRSSSAIQNTAYANDGFNEPVGLTARTTFKARRIYLPQIYKH